MILELIKDSLTFIYYQSENRFKQRVFEDMTEEEIEGFTENNEHFLENGYCEIGNWKIIITHSTVRKGNS